MSDLLARYAKLNRPAAEQPEWERGGNEQEQRALATLQKEAKRNGATLATGGKGGLPPSLVLGVMRRDGFTCKRCGKRAMLSVHHKGHVENPTSKKLKALGSKNVPQNLATICETCHDGIHEEDREGNDKE